ncbi:MAG TPA: IPT/TIG domain-containing protein, partial [Acidimicrobiales bacterium]|nr:IPT/TIG domain-containing protein [Acidimicrobiales bacterium]
MFAVAALVPVTLVTGLTAGTAAAAGNGPVVKHLTPHHGLRGTAVAVEGTNLNGAMAVAFGGVEALSFHVVSGKAIIARAPLGSGTVDVTVTTANGTSSTSPRDDFTYDVPLVKSVQPRQGPAGGGTR